MIRLLFRIGKGSSVCSSSSASEIKVCCKVGLLDSPRGCPKSKGTDNTRGGFTFFATLSTSVIDTVDIPTSSITR